MELLPVGEGPTAELVDVERVFEDAVVLVEDAAFEDDPVEETAVIVEDVVVVAPALKPH